MTGKKKVRDAFVATLLCMTRRKGRTMAYYKKISVEIRQK
jgi:hypothetical protein